MKKVLLSALALAVTMGVSAQRWDFTNWSSETVENLKAVNPSNTEWSDIEKKDGTAPTDISKENCFWEVKAQGNATEGATLMANGQAIKELEGLLYTNTTDRSLAIAVNYPETSIGTYNGPSYLWLGSSNKNYFVIPGIKAGTKITIGLESHKSTDPRGVELYVGWGNTGTKLKDVDGNDIPNPTTYVENTWYVPEDLTDAANEDGTYDITIRNTNGCHLYFIDCGGGEQNYEDAKVAYLYDSSYNGSYTTQGGIDSDPIFNEVLAANFQATAIDIKDFTAADEDTLNALCNYDVVVVSEAMSSGQAFAKTLVNIINRVPMLNLKSFVYKKSVWNVGEGKNPTKDAEGNGVTSIVVAETALEHELFANVQEWGENNDIQIYAEAKAGNLVQGYSISAGSIFEGDECLATAGDQNAIHMHGIKNTYLLLPLSSDNLIDNLTVDGAQIIYNAVTILAGTKGKVTPANKPTITSEYANNETTVTITTSTAEAVIYYTLDGTDPTEASAVYTEPIKVSTDKTTVKAMAVKQGYDNSEIASAEIAVKAKAAAPVITITDGVDGIKIITMKAAEGLTIHYNLAAAEATTASPVYSEPIVVTRSTDISAIAAGEGLLESDAVYAVAEIAAFPFRKDTLATVTFEASQGFVHTYSVTAEDGTVTEKTITITDKTYLWGQKKAWSYYYANGDSTEVNQDVKVADFGNGWVVESKGQVCHMHNDGSNTVGAGYGPATTADADFVKGGIQFLGKSSGDPYSGCLYTNADSTKFAGPFDIAVWMNGATTNVDAEPTGNELLEISTSTDGTTWTVLDTLSVPNQKAVRRVVAHYDGTEAVYLKFAHAGGNKCMLQQIQILGVGGTSDIEIPAAATDAEVVSVDIYNLAGVKLNAPTEGLNIVRKTYSNGTVKVLKVMNK